MLTWGYHKRTKANGLSKENEEEGISCKAKDSPEILEAQQWFHCTCTLHLQSTYINTDSFDSQLFLEKNSVPSFSYYR